MAEKVQQIREAIDHHIFEAMGNFYDSNQDVDDDEWFDDFLNEYENPLYEDSWFDGFIDSDSIDWIEVMNFLDSEGEFPGFPLNKHILFNKLVDILVDLDIRSEYMKFIAEKKY